MPHYREFLPGPRTRAFVDCYWTLEDGSSAKDVQRIVPDGRPELIVNLATPLESLGAAGWGIQPGIFFAGQITGPMQVRSYGVSSIIGVRFRPDGLHRLLRMPANELTSQVVPVDALAPRLLRELQRVRDWRDVDRALADWAGENGGDPAIAAAVDAAVIAGGKLRLDDMACLAALSPRQFERRFFLQVGLGPKVFCRMQRFQRVMNTIQRPGANWVSAAMDCGYFDQAHLIRDFREFAGEVPTALFAPGSDLATHFLATSDFSKTRTAGFE